MFCIFSWTFQPPEEIIPYKDIDSVTDAGGVNILYAFGIETPPGWLRGNTHTHSNKSDCKSEPEEFFAHCKSMGYDFLVISDHISTEFPHWKSEPCHDLSDTDAGMLCIDGEEMTSTDNHTNGIGIDQNILPGTIQENLSAAVDTDPSGGISTIAHLNHPVSQSLLTVGNLSSLVDFKFMEICNAGTETGNAGADEALWKELLDEQKKIYGFASDDAHDLSEDAGRAWIMVKATSRTKEAILGAIDQGHFYATTGVMLNHCEVRNGKLSVDSINGEHIKFMGVDPQGPFSGDYTARSAEYNLDRNPYYVSAVITNDHDETAWCQPVFVNDMP
ncbi:MAG: CehA/McbA family metallohydrolase [Deltaproteobacteria bacterium]|nr:CehA/McbA family metallohydrolase [Deltaproteobacteria bacterium]